MIRRPPRSTPHSFPTRRSSDLNGRRFAPCWGGILTPAQMAALRPHLGKPGSPAACAALGDLHIPFRSEEHTSELQSLMRISYAVFCLKKKKQINHNQIVNNKTNKETSSQSQNTIDYTGN